VDAERAEAALRDERRSRSAGEKHAASSAGEARSRIDVLESELTVALEGARRSEDRYQREAARARALEEEICALRRALDAEAVDDAVAVRQPGAGPGASGAATAGVVSASDGTVDSDDSADAVRAMVSTPGAVLVIDGYGLAKRVWPDAARSEQRSRLAMALAAAHLRGWCDVTVVFDGDITRRIAPLCRPGLRVLFSASGERAGDVVVREVEGLPKEAPVFVASDDAWVNEHAESAGARVVSVDALVPALDAGAADL